MIRRKKIFFKFVIFILLIIPGILNAQTKPWVSAYYAGWMQGQNNDGYLTSQNIDYSAVTQVIHFAIMPNSDGSLDWSSNSITPANSSALISSAHSAGVKALICVGGWNSESGFHGATSLLNITTFVSNLVNFVKARGYDGIDIDWETLSATDAVQYTAFITALRSALDQISPRPLLTAATQWQPAIFAAIYSKFDEINLMSYDMSGAWTGWVTWHNSPVYNGSITFPSTGALVPSINDMVSSFSLAGIPVSKLGIGIDFYGYVWSGGTGTPTGGVTAPDQSWSTAPTVQANVPYYTIMQQYYQQSRYHWDSGAQASYLSIDNSGSANDQFISYDDTATCSAKVNYVKSNGLGGLIVWELGAGYQSTNPAGQQQLLLESIKNAINGSSSAPVVSILSPSNGSTISGSVNISANVTDNVKVISVVFKIDGSQIGNTITLPPYTIPLNSTQLTNGVHVLTAVATDLAGNSKTVSININTQNSTTDVSSNKQIPTEFKLEQNYPNPFNPSTNIEFALPVSSHVVLEIYNILGQKAATLIDEDMSAGLHSVSWNAASSNLELSSGIYIYQLHAGNVTLQKKMNYLK